MDEEGKIIRDFHNIMGLQITEWTDGLQDIETTEDAVKLGF